MDKFPRCGGRGKPLLYSSTESVLDWGGEALGKYRWFGRARRGSGTVPATNFTNPGPQWARKETHPSTPGFARREDSAHSRESTPVNGGPGGGRIWERSSHPEPTPGGSLASFWPSRKKLAPQSETLSSYRIGPEKSPFPSSAPFGAPVPIPCVAAPHLPLTRGVAPQGKA